MKCKLYLTATKTNYALLISTIIKFWLLELTLRYLFLKHKGLRGNKGPFKWGEDCNWIILNQAVYSHRGDPGRLWERASQISDYREGNQRRAPAAALRSPSQRSCTGCTSQRLLAIKDRARQAHEGRPIPGRWGIPATGNFHWRTSWSLGGLSLELHCRVRHFHPKFLPPLPLSFTWESDLHHSLKTFPDSFPIFSHKHF